MRNLRICAVLAVGLAWSGAVAAEEPTLQELLARLQQMETRIADLEKQLELAKTLSPPVAPDLEDVRALVREELAGKPAAAMPAWADSLKFGGRFRLRSEWIADRDAVPGGVPIADRYRSRYLLQFGFEKAVTDELLLGFGLSSGPADPTTANQTMGTAFQRGSIWVDKAYLQYSPKSVPGLSFLAGRHPNNWDPVGTQMMWDSDINPEGLQARYAFDLGERVKPWVQAEYFLVYEHDPTVAADLGRSTDTALVALQAGSKFSLADGVDLTTTASYYDLKNPHDPTFGGATFSRNDAWSGGNTTVGAGASKHLAADFRIADLGAEVAFKAGNVPCAAFGNYVRNFGASGGSDTGWKAGFRINKVKQKGDWAFQADYANVERDAVIAYFGESEHYYSNYRGPSARISYGLLNNTTLSGTVYWLDRVSGGDDSILLSQIDLTVKF